MASVNKDWVDETQQHLSEHCTELLVMWNEGPYRRLCVRDTGSGRGWSYQVVTWPGGGTIGGGIGEGFTWELRQRDQDFFEWVREQPWVDYDNWHSKLADACKGAAVELDEDNLWCELEENLNQHMAAIARDDAEADGLDEDEIKEAVADAIDEGRVSISAARMFWEADGAYSDPCALWDAMVSRVHEYGFEPDYPDDIEDVVFRHTYDFIRAVSAVRHAVKLFKAHLEDGEAA